MSIRKKLVCWNWSWINDTCTLMSEWALPWFPETFRECPKSDIPRPEEGPASKGSYKNRPLGMSPTKKKTMYSDERSHPESGIEWFQ